MADRFRFQLDPLLRIRLRQEEDRKLALAKVLGKLNEQTERALRYDRMIRDEHHRLRQGRLVGPLDMRELAHHRRYVNSVLRGMIQTLCERAGTQQQSEQARSELVEAVKQRKVLDKLKARRRAEWQRRLDKVEAADLDEMGVIAAHRASKTDR
jgi:flagellar protein FliJ